MANRTESSRGLAIPIVILLLSFGGWLTLILHDSIQLILFKRFNIPNADHLQNLLNFIGEHYPLVKNYLSIQFVKLNQWTQIGLSYLKNCFVCQQMIWIVINALEVILARMLCFLMAMPFFIAILIFFAIDGLAQRDIRKFQGERESTFFFHRLSPYCSRVIYLVYFVYLASLWQIPIMMLMIPASLLSGIFAMQSIKYFKKYL